MLRVWASVFFLVIVVWRSTDACSCMISHPQTQFCNSDFVALVTPKRRGEDPDGLNAFYTLKIDTLFKANKEAKVALQHGRVYTGLQSAACGVYLEIDKQYILAGDVYEGRARINLCGFHALWADIPPSQIKAFKELFKKSCDCNICVAGQFCTPSTKECNFDFQTDRGNCYSQFGVCLPKNGVCQWNKNCELDKCLAK